MALEVYQEIFCRMVASSAFRDRVLEQPDQVLNSLDLTERERQRLIALAGQPGMRVNTAIHRANRLTPLDQTLPLTCFLLGARLQPVLERYWNENPSENLQASAECERFSAFLNDEMRAGRIYDPYIEEVLAFERVCTEMRFFTEAELRRRGLVNDDLPPLVRIVTFRHDPVPLLEALADLKMPAQDITPGEFHLLIDYRSGEAEFRLVDSQGLGALRELSVREEE